MTRRRKDPGERERKPKPAGPSEQMAISASEDPQFIELTRLYSEKQDDDQSPGELRADAARNRERILSAAEELFAKTDGREITMDDIARAAGIGRATLYRRFTTTSAVALAILNDYERRLQKKILFGGPPLGRGAPAAERLSAFYRAMVKLLERHLHLALSAETGHDRFGTGAYRFWRQHVRILLTTARAEHVDQPGSLYTQQNPGGADDRGDVRDRKAKAPGVPGVPGDVDTTVDLLLAPLAPELYHYQRHVAGLSQAQITASLDAFARRLL